ncbi:MAG: hypothetical protein IKO68_05170 [Oscillospiraceae bacterium]|nr:hypothetical protein [Oscillospiraceae bacterium]MBR4655951.1 hypothetical protein [Oscillospiraceae bacterium]
MKPIVWVLLAILTIGLLVFVGCRSRTPEDPGTEHPSESGVDTTPDSNETELRFSSFDGGGPQFRAYLDDPTLAAVEGKREYKSRNHDKESGSPYDMVFRFRALKPGTTRLLVLGESPIIKPQAHLYQLTVHENLKMTFRAIRTISGLTVFRNGSIAYDSYAVTLGAEGFTLTVNEEESCPMDQETADAIYAVVEKYDLASWNGFNKSQQGVLDGEGFWLELSLTDGTSIYAAGDNVFPAHYFDAMGELWTILQNAAGLH